MDELAEKLGSERYYKVYLYADDLAVLTHVILNAEKVTEEVLEWCD